jgi:hypothetical protein
MYQKKLIRRDFESLRGGIFEYGWSSRIGRQFLPTSLFKVKWWSLTNPRDGERWGGFAEVLVWRLNSFEYMHGFTYA